MSQKYIMCLDEGTTGTRVLIVDKDSNVKASEYSEFTQFTPTSDRVEHDAEEIWDATVKMMRKAMQTANLKPADIAAIGITNQRATSVVWDRKTGKPIYHAIVWQDNRNRDYVAQIMEQWGHNVYYHGGWALWCGNSAVNARWMLENVPGARARAEAGDLCWGNIDSWLIYKMTAGKVHAESACNATVSGSFNIQENTWYKDWLDFLGNPLSMYPKVVDSSGFIGMLDASILGAEIPITGDIGDQQSGLFGNGCINPGDVKCTHGTGSFPSLNTGKTLKISTAGPNNIIAWRINGVDTYALEGMVMVTGSLIQWLRDGAGLIEKSSDVEKLATSVPDNGGIYFVPALTGLGAPYWDNYARGLIIGINRGTTKAHICRAAEEAIVYATKGVVDLMASEGGVTVKSMMMDGGAVRDNFLMQFQADIMNAKVVRPKNPEATAMGASYLAGLAVKYWDSPEDCFRGIKVEKEYTPQMPRAEAEKLYSEYLRAVDRSKKWVQ